ncbi:hypothetical protein T02_5787 [Trichinella nativa]|uniref:Uncharacterized protein n=1 Tax=Trichinella nativa TaxID=6335 RepID=A0A0V1LNU0_9BILA|nr:hypothetical protein T02_5787 [Trichinella nativa]
MLKGGISGDTTGCNDIQNKNSSIDNFTPSRAFLSDDDTDILKKARAWIAKHRQDYSLAFSTSDDPCEVLYDTAKRQLRWIRREYRLPLLKETFELREVLEDAQF